jgi:hypothetical protein
MVESAKYEGAMVERRLVYTQKQVARLLRVTERTLIRWRKQGKHFHPWQDPSDPLERWLYDANEVEAYRKRKSRSSGGFGVAPRAEDVPTEPWRFERTLPGPVAGRIYARLQQGEPIDEICKAEGVAPQQVIRLEELRRHFEAQRERPPPRPSEPRLVTDEKDPEIAALARELEEERLRPKQARDEAGDADESEPISEADGDEDEEEQ